ncbi:MAG: peptide chain release factor N(5)-glutamine methyltransferase [Acetatifactor sp.]|nr:peptide chain release factor N(5)-glutamine methyltransferase [Acetatifactor sp.]
MNYKECYNRGKGALAAAGVPEADLDARLLLEYVCGTDRNTLLVHGDREVTAEEQSQYDTLIEKRAQRVPLQQITGVQDFMGLTFQVNSDVLIPRQDTEILVEEVLGNLHDGMRVLDMCTGSGCILISLLRYSNGCEGTGADVSEKALAVAQRNAAELLPRPEAVSFVQSDLFESVEGTYDIVVSNPPYIATDVIETLMPEVKDHEPRIALDGTGDGLFFYRQIIKDCKKNLAKGGMLFFEIGYDQGEAVRLLMEENGFLEVTVKQDYSGLDRVVFGTLCFDA